MSNLTGDGIVNDGLKIQDIINMAINSKVKKITFPHGTYRVDNNLMIMADDIEIDFSGSTILSYAKAVANIWGEYGLFNFRGGFANGDVLTYMRSLFKNVPVAAVLTELESIKGNLGASYTKYSRVTTSNNDQFSVGDDILLYGVTAASYSKDSYDPFVMMTTKILAIDANYLYVDYYTPYKFTEFLDTSNFPSRVIKLNTIKNVALKNVNIVDMTTIAVPGTPTQQELAEAVSPISAICVNGLTIENVNVLNHKYNAFNAWYSRNINVVGFTARNAQMWGGGQGYLTQIRACQQIKLSKIVGEKCRHVVDFSFSAYGLVEEAKGIDGLEKDFDMHGMCEHDIIWNRCDGQIILGNAIKDFPNMVANITFNQCDIKNMDNVGSYLDERYIENIIFDKCNIYTRYFFNYQQVIARDCNIYWDAYPVVPLVPKRGRDIETSLHMSNCKITLNIIDNAARFIYMSDYDKLTIRDTNFVYSDTSINEDVGVTLALNHNKDVMLDNVHATTIKLRVSTARTQASISIVNSIFVQSGTQDYWLTLYALANTTLLLNIKNNVVQHSGFTTLWRVLDARDTNMTYAKVIMHLCGNQIIGNFNAQALYANSVTNQDTDKLTAYLYDFDNIISHKNPSASNAWSVDNMVIS